jgi:hypothetical protein
MTSCPNCGHDLSGSAASFCGSCGQPVPGAGRDTVTAARPTPPYDPGSPYAAPGTQDPYAPAPAQDPYAPPPAQDPYGTTAPYGASSPYGTPVPYQSPPSYEPLPRPETFPASAEPLPPPPGGPPRRPRRAARQKSRPARNILIIALVAIVVLGGAGAYVLMHHKASGVTTASQTQGSASAPAPRNSPSPQSSSSSPQAPPSSEKDQVTQFGSAVRGSAKARALVTTAVPQVASCAATPAAGITQLHQAISERQHITATLSGLPVSQLPNGRAMRADLRKVLQLSVTADHDFISWMQDPATVQSCPGSTATDAHYAAGVQASQQAVQAKEQFLALWNPLAKRFGQPTYTTLDI